MCPESAGDNAIGPAKDMAASSPNGTALTGDNLIGSGAAWAGGSLGRGWLGTPASLHSQKPATDEQPVSSKRRRRPRMTDFRAPDEGSNPMNLGESEQKSRALSVSKKLENRPSENQVRHAKFGGSSMGIGPVSGVRTAAIDSAPKASDLVEMTVDGVQIKYRPSTRELELITSDGSTRSELGVGNSSTFSSPGKYVIKTNDLDLWVNGKKISLESQAGPAQISQADSLRKALSERFPGVEFKGNPSSDSIGEGVTIAPGAVVYLRGTTITNSDIGPAAMIGPNSTIDGSSIHGDVNGGTVLNSRLDKNALVDTTGTVKDSTLESKSEILGTVSLDNCLVMGAKIIGAVQVTK